MILQLTVEERGKLDFDVKKILNAGYTARNQDEVRKHIDELTKARGIPPLSVPEFFPKITDRITTADKITVLSENTTSGEAEFVLLFNQDKIYVGVGSDHTDRVLGQQNMLASKQVCPNVISTEVWLYEEVESHWDDLILRSWVLKDKKRQLYQEARLKTFMKVEELINKIKSQIVDSLGGTVFYSGTVPTISGEICCSSYFEVKLIDEKRGKSIGCAYSVEPITWFKGEIDVAYKTK